MPTVLSWNVAGRVRESQERQIAGLDEHSAAVVCLQEVTPANHSAIWAQLETAPA